MFVFSVFLWFDTGRLYPYYSKCSRSPCQSRVSTFLYVRTIMYSVSGSDLLPNQWFIIALKLTMTLYIIRLLPRGCMSHSLYTLILCGVFMDWLCELTTYSLYYQMYYFSFSGTCIPWICHERSFSEFYLFIWNQLVFNQRLRLFVQSPQPYLLIFAWRN